LHVNEHNPGLDPQQKARREHEHVEQRYVLEPEGIGQHEQVIRGRDQAEFRVEREAQRQQHRGQSDGHGPGPGEGQVPARDGSVALARVQPVLLAVGDVVDQVDGPREQAEDDKAFEGANQRVWAGELAVKNQGRETRF